MATYAEQIAAYENKRAANLKAMEDIMAKSATRAKLSMLHSRKSLTVFRLTMTQSTAI